MRLTHNVLDTSSKFMTTSLVTKKRAIDNARGYRRLAEKAPTEKEREQCINLCKKAIKVARKANLMLLSIRRFEKTITKNLLTDNQ